MIAGEFPEVTHVFVTVDAFQSVVRFGNADFRVGEGQADFLAAVIKGKDLGADRTGIMDFAHKVSIT